MKTFKRIILLVLAALLVFSAAGCKTKKQKEAEELERQKAAAIENAKNFVKNLYINDAKSTGADYEVISQIAVSGTTYEIEWTVEIVSGEAEDVKVTKSEGKTIIDVNENATVATEYKLVATIKGTDVSVSFNHTVPAFKYTSYEEWLDACKKGSQEALVIKGYVICVVAEGSSSAGSFYFQDADGHGYYAYNPSTKLALEYGDEVLVKGTGTVYGGQYEFNKGCTVEKTGEKATTLKINDGTAAWAAAASQTDESLIPYQNALVKLTGCTMAEVDGSYYYFTVGNGTAKFNLYDTYYFLSEAQRKAITDQWAAGKTFDIVGLVSCYSKAYQVYPISEDCLSNVSFPQLSDAEAVAVIKDSLALTQVKFEKDTELAVDVKGYNDQVSISWAANNEQVVFNAETGKLVITLGEADVEVTVTATLTAGEATDTKEFKLTLLSASSDIYVPKAVEEAKVGTYKFALYQATLGKYLYADGTCNDYLGTTEKADKAADFVVAKVEGKEDEYTIKVGDKFVEVFENDSQKVRIHLVDTATGSWKYDATLKLFTYALTGCAKDSNNTTYYLGTYSNYTTMSASGTSYISGDKMSTIGVSQFPAYFGNVTVVEAEWAALEEAKAGTYKFALYQATLGKYLYADGTCNDYLGTTEKYSKAAEFVVAKVEGKDDEYTIKVGDKFVEVFENDSQKVRIHLVDTATGSWKFDATLKLFKYELTGCAKDSNNTTYYLGTYSNYTTMSASGTSYISGDKMSTIGVSQFPAYFGDLVEIEDTAKEYEIAVAANSSNKAQVKELSAESGVKGATFTFKVEAAENYVVDSVEVNGQVVEAENGVYTATVTGKMSIRVFTSEAAATEKSIEIDFTQLMQEIPQSKNARHSTSSVEITVRGVTFDLRNVYQASSSYLILAGKLTDADAEGNTSKTPAWIANKTPIPGKIISITVYGNAAGNPSGSAVYYLDAFENAKIEALETSSTTITGLKDNPLVYTAAAGSSLYYFNLSTTVAANGQVTKIVITYEPGEAPQPAPTLTGVKVGGADANLTLNAQTGEYEGTFSLSRQWARVNFVKVYSDASEVKLMPADTTIIGTGILNKLLTNSTDTEVLFYDSGVELGDFCYSLSSETKYAVKYNPTTNTLTVDVATEEVPTTIKGVKYGGEKQGLFELKDGKYEAVVELGAWKRISFAVVDANDKQIALWYTNAKFEGEFTPADKTGDQWEGKIYHELGDSLRWMPPAEGAWKFVYDPATKTMTASKYVPETPAAQLTGVKVAGSVDVALVLNAESGLYEGTFTLKNQWSTVTFKGLYDDETEAILKSPEVTISGTGVINELHACTNTEVLFFDADVQAGYFCYSLTSETKYAVTYNPQTKALTLDVATEEVPTTVKAVKYDGAKQGEFAKQQDGTYVAYVQLNAWNRVKFAVVDENDKQIALWYTNATFAGDVTPADKTGDQWEGKLYHELGDGLRLMPPANGAWEFVYDPATKTMTIAKYTDQTAPVITVSDAVMQALAAHDFVENEDASALFGQLLAGVSAKDELDGAIAVTQDMVNLGGLNPAKLVKGDYTIVITVTDAAGNAGKKELKLHVRGLYADVDLLADLPKSKTDYKSSHWTYDQYQNDGTWKTLTNVQMRCREKPEGSGVWTTNMAVGTMPMRYIYNNGNKSLGIANTLTFNVWNDFAPVNVIQVKVVLVGVDGTQKYIVGGEDTWFDVAKNIANVPQTIEFDDFEVKNVVFIGKSSASGYIYFNNLKLTYEEPASSPAALQFTNVAEGEDRQHIEGAGAWVWLDATALGITESNKAEYEVEVTTTGQAPEIVGYEIDVIRNGGARCYVRFVNAEFAATTTINVSITHNGVVYQGTIVFAGNELA